LKENSIKNLGPEYDKEKEKWRILTNKETYAMVEQPTITEKIGLNMLRWFGHVQGLEENRIPPKSSIYEFGSNKVER
jgi:hypothetical protein